ncbi:MAG: HPr kinase/phosphatase C-terminal domain-containing protein [Pseudomonadota bacterium]
MTGAVTVVHATAIALGDECVLLRGPPGSGKSDLALRCLALAPQPPLIAAPAELVSDDQVQLTATGEGYLEASAPKPIAGLIEIRGLGIRRISYRQKAHVRLVIDLGEEQPERLPPDPLPTVEIAGVALPRRTIRPFEASAHLKVLIALQERRTRG